MSTQYGYTNVMTKKHPTTLKRFFELQTMLFSEIKSKISQILLLKSSYFSGGMNSLKLALIIQPFESFFFFCADKTLLYTRSVLALPLYQKST